MQIAITTPNGQSIGQAELRRNARGGLILDGQIVLATSVSGSRVMCMLAAKQVYDDKWLVTFLTSSRRP